MRGKISKLINRFAKKTGERRPNLKRLWKSMSHRERGKFSKKMRKFL